MKLYLFSRLIRTDTKKISNNIHVGIENSIYCIKRELICISQQLHTIVFLRIICYKNFKALLFHETLIKYKSTENVSRVGHHRQKQIRGMSVITTHGFDVNSKIIGFDIRNIFFL